jgi:hypothetical protein
MAEIRTLDQLEAYLTEELKWRLHELTQWEAVAKRVRSHEKSAIVRGGTALLYAHWEGYVKSATRAYLEFVSRKGLKIAELRPELAAIALRGVLGKGEASKSSQEHTSIVEVIRNGFALSADLPYDSATIRTFSNLNFDRFADIMHSVGCDAGRHELNRFLIDNRLLRHRNDIAHGRAEYVELDDWLTIKERVVIMLTDVRTQLSNAAATASYKAPVAPAQQGIS